DILKEQHGLLLEGPFQLVGVAAIQRAIGIHVASQLARAKPLLDKTLDRFSRLAVLQHPSRLLAKRFRFVQLSFGGDAEQLVVWHAEPEEIREPRRNFRGADESWLGRWIGIFQAKEEMGRDEHALEREEERP